MKHLTITSSLLFLAIMNLTGLAFAENEKSFAPNVDMTTGAIHVPEDYTLWPTLGHLDSCQSGEWCHQYP
jgi:hypothetical protein